MVCLIDVGTKGYVVLGTKIGEPVSENTSDPKGISISDKTIDRHVSDKRGGSEQIKTIEENIEKKHVFL